MRVHVRIRFPSASSGSVAVAAVVIKSALVTEKEVIFTLGAVLVVTAKAALVAL